MRMPGVFELLLKLAQRSRSCSLNRWVRSQELQSTFLLQFREQIQCDWIIRFEACSELIDQTRLRADQRILVTCQLFEFRHLLTVRGQSMQIGEIGTPSLSQQVGIDQIRLGSTGRSPTIHRARIDWVHRPTSLQKVNNQQTVGGFNNTCHVFFGRRTNTLHQKGVQLVKSLWAMINTDRTHLMSLFITRQSIMVFVCPVTTGIPHQKRSSLKTLFLRSRALILWRSKRRLSHNRFGSGTVPRKSSFQNRSCRVEQGDFPWRVQSVHRTSVFLFQPFVERAC